MKKIHHRKAPMVNDSSKRSWDMAIIALLIAVGVIYFPLVNAEFINFDDPDYVYENSYVTGGLSWEGLIYAFSTNDMANWHPLTWLSLMLDAQLYGDWAGGFHFTNVMLHAAGVVAYYFAMNSLFKMRMFAFLATLLYAIHPLHVESVAWVSERKGILSTFFWMLALFAYSYYVHRPSRQRMLLVAAALTFGLMSKQMLVSFPIAILLLDYWPLRREVGLVSLLKEKTLLFAIVAAFAVIAYWAQDSGGAVVSLASASLATRCSNALVAFNGYLLQYAIPVGLYIPRISPQEPHDAALLALSLVAVVVTSAFAVYARSKSPHFTVGILWYWVTILPVIGIIPIGIQWMADRYTDIPLMGISWAILWPLTSQSSLTASRQRVHVLFFSVVVTVLVCVSATQVQKWQNSLTLFNHTLAHDPANQLAHLHLGTMYMVESDFSNAELSLAGLINRDDVNPIVRSMAANNLIHMLTTQGRTGDAVKLLGTFPEFDYASHTGTVIDLSNALQVQGDADSAFAVLNAAIKVIPDHAGLRIASGTVLLGSGDIDGAKGEFAVAIKLAPQMSDAYYNLGLAEARTGNYGEAIENYREAIQIERTRPDFYNNLAVAHGALGEAGEAMDNYRKAIALKADYALAHYNLACLLVSEGMLVDAVDQLNKAYRFSGDNQALATAAQEKLNSLAGIQ